MIQKHDVKSIEECMAICHKMGSKIAGLEVHNIYESIQITDKHRKDSAIHEFYWEEMVLW